MAKAQREMRSEEGLSNSKQTGCWSLGALVLRPTEWLLFNETGRHNNGASLQWHSVAAE